MLIHADLDSKNLNLGTVIICLYSLVCKRYKKSNMYRYHIKEKKRTQ